MLSGYFWPDAELWGSGAFRSSVLWMQRRAHVHPVGRVRAQAFQLSSEVRGKIIGVLGKWGFQTCSARCPAQITQYLL